MRSSSIQGRTRQLYKPLMCKFKKRIELQTVNSIVELLEKKATEGEFNAHLKCNLNCRSSTLATALYKMGIIWHERLKILLTDEIAAGANDSDNEDEFEDAFEDAIKVVAEAVAEPEPAAEPAKDEFEDAIKAVAEAVAEPESYTYSTTGEVCERLVCKGLDTAEAVTEPVPAADEAASA